MKATSANFQTSTSSKAIEAPFPVKGAHAFIGLTTTELSGGRIYPKVDYIIPEITCVIMPEIGNNEFVNEKMQAILNEISQTKYEEAFVKEVRYDDSCSDAPEFLAIVSAKNGDNALTLKSLLHDIGDDNNVVIKTVSNFVQYDMDYFANEFPKRHLLKQG